MFGLPKIYSMGLDANFILNFYRQVCFNEANRTCLCFGHNKILYRSFCYNLHEDRTREKYGLLFNFVAFCF